VRAAARLAAVLGAVGIGWVLFREAPREVVLVYDLSRTPGATSVHVEVKRGAEVVRRAALTVPAPAGQVRHRVELPDGDYALDFRVATPSGAVAGRRPLEVREAGTVVLPLGP
jgi:hypothetical protein